MLQVQRTSMARSSKDYYESPPPQPQLRPRLPRPRSYDSIHSTWSSASASSTYVHAPSIYTLESSFTNDEQRPDKLDDGYPATLENSAPFHVLAMYDYVAEDPTHVSFQKNDIFEIVAVVPSGWGAAQIDDNVGWLPMGFVALIHPDSLDRLLKAPHDVRAQLYEEEMASYDESFDSDPDNYDGDIDPAVSLFEDSNEVSVLTTVSGLRSPQTFPTDVTPFVTSRFEIPKNTLLSPTGALPNPHSPRPHPYSIASQPPRTPRTPVPPRGPAPAPTLDTDLLSVYQPTQTRPPSSRMPHFLKVDTKVNRDKPTPPTPVATTPSSTSSSSQLPSGLSSAQPLSATKLAWTPPKKSLGLPRSTSLGSNSTSPARPRRLPGGNSPISTRNVDNSSTSGSPIVPFTTSPNEIESISATPQDSTFYSRVRARDKIRRITGEDEAQAFHNAKLAQASLPWYLKPEHVGDEIKLDHDGRVIAGTLEALVERLTVETLIPEHEESYRHTFLTTFHSFTTAERVVELLIDRYEMDSPIDLAEDQFNEWKTEKLRKTQARVLHVFSVWVDKFGLMNDDPQVVRRLREFLGLVNSSTPHAHVAKKVVLSIDDYRNSDIDIKPFAPVMTPKRRTSRAKSSYKNDILRLDHGELAKQLTLYEARLYLRVRPHECIAWGSSIHKGESVRNLLPFVSTSDKLAAWVKMSVLANDALGKRADTIDMWIKVAEKCRALHNYSSMSAIIAALTSPVIAKLQLTWAHVHRASHIEPLMKLVEPTSNFSTIRNLFNELGNASMSCLPYIGIYLSDMVKTYETFPNTIEVTTTETDIPCREIRLINFMKYRKMADVAQNIIRHQPRILEYKISETQPIMQFVETQLSIAASKDEGGFWMRSQEVQHAELAHADIRKGLEAAGF